MIFEFRRCAAALFLVAIIAGTPLHAGDDGSDSTFRVVEADLNIGRVVAGATATGTFTFQNDGEVDVKILRAKPS